jgi:hypothetical protein
MAMKQVVELAVKTEEEGYVALRWKPDRRID